MPDYSLITATRYDQSICLLNYHHQRLTTAAQVHDWDNVFLSLEKLEQACVASIPDKQLAYKLRIVLSKSGALAVHATPAPPLAPDSVLEIYLDREPTPSSIFTSTKTTNRAHYDRASARCGLTPGDASADVLLYNEHGHLTETTSSNIAFNRSSIWLTPPTSTGCLPGVFRRHLLENGRVREAETPLSKDDVKDAELVLVFNSVRECRFGRIKIL